MTTAQVYDFLTTRIQIGTFTLKTRPVIGRTAAALFLAASILVFVLYAPLGYGNMWTKAECNQVKLFPTWDWDCNNFLDSYADYSLAVPSASGPAPTSQAAHGPAPPVAEDPKENVVVTPGSEHVIQDGGVVAEEKVEYRDENGQLLDEAQVKELEGKVSFSTRYETRTRLVDQAGNEIADDVVVGQDEAEAAPGGGEAGTRADGVDPETPAAEEDLPSQAPPVVGAEEDVRKERSVERSGEVPRPGGEGLEGTAGAHEEL